MNFALFDRPSVLAPLNDLISWLAPAPLANGVAANNRHQGTSALGFKFHHPANPICVPAAQAKQKSQGLAQKPLRIVRILEVGHAPANVGRMVISGRMSDVCAELDRLAAKEASLH